MTTEFQAKTMRGAPVLGVAVTGLLALIAVVAIDANRLDHRINSQFWNVGMVLCGLAFLGVLFLFAGLRIIAPNTGLVVVFFGTYKGTVKTPGFWWINPLAKKIPISLRIHNMVTPTIKVNDIKGNPIEIGAVVVWRVSDAARATFDVESFSSFVDTQCESALRHLASVYPYDGTGADHEVSLRGSTDEVSKALASELQERVAKAGITIDETRLSHLAYAAEIAGAMLRRQQADAVVSARFRIVEGAVGMVESALEHLEKGGKVKLDDERKAAMVSNLMVVLCGDHSVQPVVNAGTLYTG